MKKRHISTLLVLALIACIFPLSAFATLDFDHIEFVGTSGGDYFAVFYHQPHWVGWNHTNVGNRVKMIQAYLYMDGQFNNLNEIDGVFGNRTESAIRAYQERYGLGADGVVGTNTWRSMAYYNYGESIAPLLP